MTMANYDPGYRPPEASNLIWVQVPHQNKWRAAWKLMLKEESPGWIKHGFFLLTKGGFTLSAATELFLQGDDVAIPAIGEFDNFLITPTTVALSTFGFIMYHKLKKYRFSYEWEQVEGEADYD